jgi:hypothetical protein
MDTPEKIKKPRVRKPRVKKEKVKKPKVKKEKVKTSPDDYNKLFNFTKIFFGNNSKWENVTNYQKKKHRFMMNRFMAIRYPSQAEKFNINKINPVAVINLWRVVGKKFTRTPGWFWTKTKKAVVTKTKGVFVPSEDTISFYLKKQEISRRDFNDGMKYYKEDLLIELERIEKILNEDD